MRNWNPLSSTGVQIFGRRFEPTYEELKHIFFIPTLINYKRFEPTYEELKLLHRNFIFVSILGFEPTYEELKHMLYNSFSSPFIKFWAYLWGIETPVSFCNTPVSFWVLSLPMRNWNLFLLRTTEMAEIVLSLPMRNWNLAQTQPQFPLSFVLSLPMRNWNIALIMKFSLGLLGFEPTYEELKLSKITCNLPLSLCFEPTYEELKQI